MQYIVEVEDNKDKFLLELLRHFSFVKAKPLTKKNIKYIQQLQSSVDEVKRAKAGKIKLQSAKDFLNEL